MNPRGTNTCLATASTILESEDAALLRLGETYLIEWEQGKKRIGICKGRLAACPRIITGAAGS